MIKKNKKPDPFQDLTWNDVQEWAGNTILSRGKDYQRHHRVQELARTPKGELVAWVQGAQRYATHVEFQAGEMDSDCTCPYWSTCKHAVAVVLEYLDQVKKGIEIPQVNAQDRRIELLEETLDMRGEDQEDEEEMEDESPRVRRHSGETAAKSLVSFLKEQNQEQLIALIEDLARRFPAVRETLQDQHELSKGTVKKMVTAVRKEIKELSAEPAWSNHWNDEGFIPDYSRVKGRLEALLSRGYADEVLVLGKELLKAGTSQVEMSHDEGETGDEISSCLDIVFRALPQSSLPPVEQMLWAVEAELEDQYNLCRGAESFWKQTHKVEDWNILAEKLMDRLDHYQPAKVEDSFSRHYRRDGLSNWVIHALEGAGRDEEIIPLCKLEAGKTGSYVRLVNFLKQAKRWEEAEQWIHKGIKVTQKQWPGIASTLRTALREIREGQGDWLGVAAFRAEDFFQNPELHTFKALEKAAERAKVWPVVRAAAMNFLETGKLPGNKHTWPLPEVGVKEPIELRQREFPATETLIDIAIAEKRPDEVIHWYDRRSAKRTSWIGGSFHDDKIAEALVDTYPDRAVGIWKGLAEKQIALTQPKAYAEAATYLRKVHRTLKKRGKENEWQKYLAGLRESNARKRRFVEILDSLAGRKIVEG